MRWKKMEKGGWITEKRKQKGKNMKIQNDVKEVEHGKRVKKYGKK